MRGEERWCTLDSIPIVWPILPEKDRVEIPIFVSAVLMVQTSYLPLRLSAHSKSEASDLLGVSPKHQVTALSRFLAV